MNNRMLIGRRQIIHGGLALGAAAFTVPGLFADLVQTATQTEGPFYPNRLPLDTDNDLIIINNSLTPAVGEITHLSGRVLNSQGTPVRNAFVEIWQVDSSAVYIHTGDTNNRDNQDRNFQGYGRLLTDSQGRYYFRTIKPVAYPGRTPHIHIAVSKNGKRVLTTQLYVHGHPANANDGLFNAIDAAAQKTVLGHFKPLANSKIGELTVDFDIVLGRTVDENADGAIHGIGKSQWQSRQRNRR